MNFNGLNNNSVEKKEPLGVLELKESRLKLAQDLTAHFSKSMGGGGLSKEGSYQLEIVARMLIGKVDLDELKTEMEKSSGILGGFDEQAFENAVEVVKKYFA